jgi:fatty acid desaturase
MPSPLPPIDSTVSPLMADASPERPPGWLLDASTRRDLSSSTRVRPGVYWADLLGSAGVGWALFVGACFLTPLDWAWWPLAIGCAFAFLRAAYFIHELTHRTERELPGFRAAWMTLVGLPILVPSLMMWPHREHHHTSTYGTPDDPEYAPVPHWSRARLIGALAIYAWVPWLLAIRWTITATFSHLHPKARAHAVGKFSTADIWHEYTRPMPEGDERRRFLKEEAMCAVFAWTALALTAVGILPWWIHLHRWAIMSLSLIINHARLLVIHDYSGGPFDGRGQTLDTLTLGPDSPLTELVAPLGSRYHALHHELPGVPYHQLGTMHRRLVAELPSDHPYRQTEISGFWAAWRRLWARAAQPVQAVPSSSLRNAGSP